MSIDLTSIAAVKKGNTRQDDEKKTSFWSKEISFSSGFGLKDKMLFYKELSSLLYAGVDFKRAFEILVVQQKKKVHKELIGNLLDKVISGVPLYIAMRDSGKFTAHEYYSIKIGEETRTLSAILPNLTQYFERKLQMKRQLVSVLTYPLFIIILTLGVLYFMLTYVVPMFGTIFKQFNKELPKITQYILVLSENFKVIFFTFIGVVLLVISAHFYFRKNINYRSVLSKIVIRIPIFGKLIKKIYLTRFTQALSLLLKAKTPLNQALGLVEKMIVFYPIESSLQKINKDITRGSTLSSAMQAHSIYDFKLVALVKIAEETNSLGETFDRIAQQYDQETEHDTKMLGVVMEPLIILIIGLIVGFVLVAMYAPIFDLSKILN